MSDYKFNTKIGNKTIHFRKWKVKDKNKYESNEDILLKREALVYDCLKEDIALSAEEFQYMLFKIREATLTNKITYEFTCEACKKDYVYECNLNEIMTTNFKGYDDIIVQNHIFTMGPLKNKNFYESTINNLQTDEEKYLFDFILHIDAYNDNNGLTFEEIQNKINDLNLDVFEEIFLKWENMKFKINNIHDVKCPHCNNIDTFEFDDLPEFFPESWSI